MTPHSLLRSWSADPGVLVALAVAALLYARGTRARRRAATSRQASFWVGWCLVAFALVSPLDVASSATLTAHMVQHLILGLVAPLAIARARPVPELQAGLPASMRRGARWWALRLGRRLHRHPFTVAAAAVAVHLGGFWLWHLPPLYDAALRNDLLHAAEHATLLVGGLALWYVVGRARWHESVGIAMAVLFASAVGSGALAAILTLANHPLHDAHLTTTAAWHVTPLEDQQLAGALMWVPGGFVYLCAAVLLFVRWLEAGPSRHAMPEPARPAVGSAAR
jgi:cytochrome c oxidase assembly factor CtaG